MASVRKRTLPSGETRWQVDYKDQSGKRRSKQFATKKEATAYETKVRAEIAQGTYLHATEAMTLAEVADHYMAHLRVRRDTGQSMEPTTYKVYESCLNRHILNPELGLAAVKMANLKARTVAEFRDRLLAAGRSVPMTKRIITTLGFILKHARANGMLFIDPLEGVVVYRQSRASDALSQEAARLLKDSVKRLVDAADEDFRPYLVVAALAGLRASEQRALRWANVDLEKGYIRVRERADILNVIGEPKTSAGNRDIPIGPMVTNTLKRWKLRCPKSDVGLVFPNRKGKIRTQTDVRRLFFLPLCQKLGITMRWHDLRHFAVSAWIDQGFSIKAVMTFAGHKDMKTTMSRYGKLFPSEEHHKALADMEKRLLGS